MNRRKKVKARGKIAIKNTRDGVVERNQTTGEEIRLSKRDTEFNLRYEKVKNDTFSELGKRQIPCNAP